MAHETREPSVLPVFRLFALLWLGLFLLGGGILLVSEAFSHSALVFYLAGIANALLLLGYLLWPPLQRYLGTKYLPIGIVIASAGPIVINHLVSLLQIHSIEAKSLLDTWPLTAILFVPLVIVAWQHPLRNMILFCLGTALLDLALAIPAARGNQWTFLSSAHGVLGRTGSFLLVGYMVARIMEIQRQQQQSLAEANTKLTHYATTLEQLATTRERNRLARELHDTLAHTLSAVAVELEAVDSLWDGDPSQARALLQRSLSVTRTGLNETRRALQALRSSPLEDLGLALAIRQEAQTVAERANLALDLHIPEPVNNLPPDVEQCIYRALQEALANVAQHAQARHVGTSLLREENRLTLTISDDGLGFDPAAVDVEHHLGIRGMRERAEMVGGTLEIESGPGQGTTVRLTLEEKP
ncbi:MAG: sensor histidine kinase [Anaerolineae bacterium]|nr:sensor histidine kinase [Anaerolineae bacterium]